MLFRKIHGGHGGATTWIDLLPYLNRVPCNFGNFPLVAMASSSSLPLRDLDGDSPAVVCKLTTRIPKPPTSQPRILGTVLLRNPPQPRMQLQLPRVFQDLSWSCCSSTARGVPPELGTGLTYNKVAEAMDTHSLCNKSQCGRPNQCSGRLHYVGNATSFSPAAPGSSSGIAFLTMCSSPPLSTSLLPLSEQKLVNIFELIIPGALLQVLPFCQ